MKSIIIVHAQIYEGSSPTFIDYVFTFYFLATDIKIGPMEAWFGSTTFIRQEWGRIQLVLWANLKVVKLAGTSNLQRFRLRVEGSQFCAQ